MATETLSVPEDNLHDVIKVIRVGLENIISVPFMDQISNETREQLTRWCDEEEAYLNE